MPSFRISGIRFYYINFMRHNLLGHFGKKIMRGNENLPEKDEMHNPS